MARTSEQIEKLAMLNHRQLSNFNKYNKIFGFKWALWAAEYNIWFPELGVKGSSKNLWDVVLKRLARIKYNINTLEMSREDAIIEANRLLDVACDRFGKESIFYELKT